MTAGTARQPTGVWQEYERWNAAVAEVLYPALDVPAPAYLDLEDEQLSVLGELMGVGADQVQHRLGQTVAATLAPAAAGMFGAHSRRLWAWSRGSRDEPPPVLAVLAVFSVAAEQMARGDGLRETNFYGRLRSLLGLRPEEEHLQVAYRAVAERYWGALNRWLAEHEGRQGLPTAYALGHRFVGLAISQALVRKADRDRLTTFFLRFGFAPGAQLPPDELVPVLDVWISQTPSPASGTLQRLWGNRDARPRIAQAASVALASWDGRIQDSDHEGQAPSGRLALALELTGFPRKRFSLAVLVYATSPEHERAGFLRSADGDVPVLLAPAIPGALSLGQSADIDPGELLGGVLQVRDSMTGAMLTRRPKPLTVFRQDQLSMRWLECDQVMLGDDVALVARADLEERLRQVLTAIARPGWEVALSGFAGLPAGWLVVRHVQVFTAPGELVRGMDDLAALVPLTTSQLRLAGGLPLPGATRGKWHSWAPPELRAVCDAPGGFTVRLLDESAPMNGSVEDIGQPARVVRQWPDAGDGVLIVDMSQQDLTDGDYRLELVPAGSRDPISSLQLRLRSGDTPDLMQWTLASQVQHFMSQPLAVIGADSEYDDGPLVQGAYCSAAPLVGQAGGAQPTDLPTDPWWHSDGQPSVTTSTRDVHVSLAGPDSCVFTGRHREVVDRVPVDRLGKPLTKFTQGTCEGCGLVRRYSTNYFANRRAMTRRGWGSSSRTVPAPAVRRDVSLLVSRPVSDNPEWDLVLDGVLHTGGGRWSLLERLAMHIAPTALAVDQVARALESLGHIDIQRDPTTLQPVEWEVSPSMLAQTANGHLMAGYWPAVQTDQAGGFAASVGGSVQRYDQRDGPASWFVCGAGAADAVALQVPDVTVGGQSASAIAATLAPLSHAVAALPRRPANVEGRIRRFDLPTARWADADDLRGQGAFRVTRFVTLDVVRDQVDCDRGTMATSTVQLSKHAAALILKERPLLAYNRATQELAVPLGADLPGLYARAAVLCSGLLPVQAGRLLVYPQVPADLASHLAHLLSH